MTKRCAAAHQQYVARRRVLVEAEFSQQRLGVVLTAAARGIQAARDLLFDGVFAFLRLLFLLPLRLDFGVRVGVGGLQLDGKRKYVSIVHDIVFLLASFLALFAHDDLFFLQRRSSRSRRKSSFVTTSSASSLSLSFRCWEASRRRRRLLFSRAARPSGARKQVKKEEADACGTSQCSIDSVTATLTTVLL